jgi:hypothetical protein
MGEAALAPLGTPCQRLVERVREGFRVVRLGTQGCVSAGLVERAV